MITLDEAIKHCKEVAEQKDLESGFDTDNERYTMTDNERADCKECAKEHKQLAEWLIELKQFKEQEPCEDAISRAEVLKVIEQMDIPEDMSEFEIKSHIGVKISTLPPATSTHKKGKWEQYGDFWKEKYRCSECKEEQPKILCGEQIIRLWSNYCPHCGAEMESEE